jgi:GntR family transcriptional regulator
VGRCDFALQAEAADERVAAILRLSPGAPVLVGHEVTFDVEERALCTGSTTYRGDAYRFTASMFRS